MLQAARKTRDADNEDISLTRANTERAQWGIRCTLKNEVGHEVLRKSTKRGKHGCQ